MSVAIEEFSNSNFSKSLSSVKEKTEQYLAFRLADEDYGVEILRVGEIRGMDKVTRVPNAPRYVKGVVNIRGAIVPVIDLRMRFGMEEIVVSQDTTIIVLESKNNAARKLMGVIVDTVSDVFDVSVSEVTDVPDFSSGKNSEFLSGITRRRDKMTMLVSVDALINVRVSFPEKNEETIQRNGVN